MTVPCGAEALRQTDEGCGRLAQNDTNLVISTEMRLLEPNGVEKSLFQIKVYIFGPSLSLH